MTGNSEFPHGCAPCGAADFGGATNLASAFQPRSALQAMIKGMRKRCPQCGDGALLHKYLKVWDSCNVCGEELHHHQADDGPPYFTMFLVGHIVIPLMLLVEQQFSPPLWVHWATWPVLALTLSLVLLPSIKGLLVGLQWALRMHGFADTR